MRRTLLLGMVVVVAAASGCMGTVAKQAVYGVTGASARYFEVKSLGGANSLDPYTSVGVAAFDASPMQGTVPGAMASLVQTATVAKLQEMKVFGSVSKGAPGAGGILIRGRFVDYDPGGSALRAVGFGVNPFLTAQIEVVDAQSGRVIGMAMVTGTIKSAVRTGANELADGVGKAVKGVFERHHTKPKDQ